MDHDGRAQGVPGDSRGRRPVAPMAPLPCAMCFLRGSPGDGFLGVGELMAHGPLLHFREVPAEVYR